MRGCLSPLSGTPREYDMVGFDTEGDGRPGGFILGALYDDRGAQVYHDRDEFVRALLSRRTRGKKLLAHNAEYDLGVSVQDDLGGWDLLRLHSRLLRAKYQDGHGHLWEAWDTGNLSYFQSLEALGTMLGYPKYEMPDWLVAYASGGLVKGKLSADQLAHLEEYCARDAEICYRYGQHLQGVLNDLGGELHSTLPASAMDLWRRSYLDRDVVTPSPLANEMCREAYYGGRTEAFRYGTVPHQYHYDIHSLYPSVMRETPLPDPATMYLYQGRPTERIVWEKEGVTRCRVLAPALHIPILPVRIGGRLLFPVGEFVGTWCHNELRLALEQGYRILDIEWQYAGAGTLQVLGRYVDDLYDRKVASQREADPSYFVYKLLLNSLYGKFGQRNDGGLNRFVRIDRYPDFLTATGIDVVHWGGETYVLEQVGGDRQPAYINVLWAAYITAAARVREWRLLSAYGDEIAYCDTDCAVGPHELPTGEGVGELGLERGPVDYEIRGEKNYRWALDDGEWGYRTAGVPKVFQPEYWARGRISYPRPTRLGEAIRDNVRMSVWRTQLKTDRPRYPKRCPLAERWPESGYVDTRPWTYAEAESMLEHARPLLSYRDGSMLSERYVAAEETRSIEMWRLRQRISALRVGLRIPAEYLTRLWDYRRWTFRDPQRMRVSEARGGRVAYDTLGQELGYPDEREFRLAIEREIADREEIRRLEDELRRVTGALPELEYRDDPIPF